MNNAIRWYTCPNCSARLDLSPRPMGDLACTACDTHVTFIDNECLYDEPGHPGVVHRCVIERLTAGLAAADGGSHP